MLLAEGCFVLTRIIVSPICLPLKTPALCSSVFLQPVIFCRIAGPLRWGIHICVFLTHFATPFLSLGSWKLCESDAPVLALCSLQLAAVVMWGSQPWRGGFYEHWPILPNKGIQAVKWEGGGTQPLGSFLQFIRVSFCSAEGITF